MKAQTLVGARTFQNRHKPSEDAVGVGTRARGQTMRGKRHALVYNSGPWQSMKRRSIMGQLTLFLGLIGLASWVASSFWCEALTWPRFGRPSQARALAAWLQEWQLGLSRGGALNELGEVPQYKFFGRLANSGLTHARNYGSFPRELL